MKVYHISHDDLMKLSQNLYNICDIVAVDEIVRGKINKEVTEMENIIYRTSHEE